MTRRRRVGLRIDLDEALSYFCLLRVPVQTLIFCPLSSHVCLILRSEPVLVLSFPFTKKSSVSAVAFNSELRCVRPTN